MHILLVEDDELLAESARLGLSQRGFVVDWVIDCRAARQAVGELEYSCMLLDLGLPDGDGLALLRRLRTQGLTVPVIIITARDELDDRIRGLEEGADDYIVKPYSLDELAARIRAVIRRGQGRASSLLRAGDVCFDPMTATVTKAGEEVGLSAMELRLLRYFMENLGKIQPRERLLQVLVGDEAEQIASNLLDVHIHHLRRKLGAECIRTIRGMGYLFLGNEG